MNREPSSGKNWAISQLVYGSVLEDLDKFFAHLNIHYLPIKGAHLICSGLSRNLTTRSMTDIDLLVREADYQKCIEFFSDHDSFTKHQPDPWRFEQAFTYDHNGIAVKLEIHHQLNRPERFHLPTEELFSRAEFQTEVRMLSGNEDALLILICHSLVHIAERFKKSTFEEIETLINQNRFCWSTFQQLLKRSGIEPFGNALLKRYARERNTKLPVELRSFFWAQFLVNRLSHKRYTGIRRNLRQLLVECSLVRNPCALAFRCFEDKFRKLISRQK
ncbi:hypothetical protein CHISP_2759 [Chitinispirillum alkaliphilum]|nr:hypothetical protein CHISP_2759 [Chitinispirillum alkaliphilum]